MDESAVSQETSDFDSRIGDRNKLLDNTNKFQALITQGVLEDLVNCFREAVGEIHVFFT